MSSRHYHSVSVSGKVDSCFLYTEHFACFFVWSFFFFSYKFWENKFLEYKCAQLHNFNLFKYHHKCAESVTSMVLATSPHPVSCIYAFQLSKKNCVSEKYKNRCIILPFSPMVSYFTDSLEHTAFSRKSNFVSINDRQMRQISATQVISK